MKFFKINTNNGQDILYSGDFETIKGCVEAAVADGVSLSCADLKGLNLTNAEMDEADLRHARLDNTNLSGANLSCADLHGASFRNAALYNACLCESDLSNAQFFDARFGGTDIAWTNLSGASFDGQSCLDLSFKETLCLTSCRYYDHTGVVCGMNKPPLIVKGLQYQIILFDEHMKVGNAVLPYLTWLKMPPEETRLSFGIEISHFMQVYKYLLLELSRKRLEDVMSPALINLQKKTISFDSVIVRAFLYRYVQFYYRTERVWRNR